MFSKREGLIVQLQEHADALTERRDRQFGVGLVSYYQRRGGLTEKQWYWVEKLVEQIEKTRAAPARTPASAPSQPSEGLVAWFFERWLLGPGFVREAGAPF